MNRLRSRLLAVAALLMCLFATATALAQTGAVTPIDQLTVLSGLIMIGSLVSGFLVQSVASGSILGQFPINRKTLPLYNFGAAFILGALPVLTKALTSGGTLTRTVAWNAIGMGLGNIVLAASGAAAHMHMQAHKSSGGSADDSGAPGVPVTTDPVTREADALKPSAARRLGGLRGLLVALCLTLVACGWWNSGGSQTVANQADTAGACVLAQVESGNVDPVSIAVSCTGGILVDAAKDLESILAFYATPAPLPDAGIAVAGMLCGATGAAPPYKGAPACITIVAIATTRTARDQARAAISAGAH